MARAVIAAILVSVVAGCGSDRRSVPSATTVATPRATARATATVPPSATFGPGAFAGINLGEVPAAQAAKFRSILAKMAGTGGITATVMTPDGLWSGAVGKADDVRDVEVTSQFGIGSITKSIVAAQVMQLVEAGELSLDRPATDYLPDTLQFDTNGATVRQLLQHRSGIPDWYDDQMAALVEADRSHVWTLDEVLARLPATRRPAGEAFEYADTNYNLVGLVIEHVRQRPLVEVLRDGVLRVGGTERLIYQPDERPTDPMAMPLGESRDALTKGGGYLPSISDASSAGPAGSLASDAPSLARWWRAFCSGAVVSEASLREMSTFVGGSDGYGLGLFNDGGGWGLDGVGHSGGNFGFSSWAACFAGARPMVIVVLANFWVDDLWRLPEPLVFAARTG